MGLTSSTMLPLGRQVLPFSLPSILISLEVKMDEVRTSRWLGAVLDRVWPKMRANLDSATAIFENSHGALQKQLKNGPIRPIKLGLPEKQNVYIDLAHRVERGKNEIGEARQLLREGWSVE